MSDEKARVVGSVTVAVFGFILVGVVFIVAQSTWSEVRDIVAIISPITTLVSGVVGILIGAHAAKH